MPIRENKREETHIIVERILSLLKLLSSNVGYSYSELAERLEISERTARRYVEAFKNVGFIIDKKNKKYLKIEKLKNQFRDINQLLHFSQEESLILNEAIESIDPNTQTSINLREKLYSLYNSDRINYPIFEKKDSGKVKQIIGAISNKIQIELIDYKSSNSGIENSRIVEPFGFTTNYIHLWAFDIAKNTNFLFRVSRIGKIEELNQKWENEHLHKEGKIDIFRMSSDIETNFKIKFSLKAYNYLIEYYPMAKQFVKKSKKNEFILEYWYSHEKGIAKFILSFIDDVEILYPSQLIDYINEKILNKKF